VGAPDEGVSVVGISTLGAPVVGFSVVGAPVVGASVVGASVVGVSVVGAAVEVSSPPSHPTKGTQRSIIIKVNIINEVIFFISLPPYLPIFYH
jgi:hypothetical protein